MLAYHISPKPCEHCPLNADDTLVNRCPHLKAVMRASKAAKVQGTGSWGTSLRLPKRSCFHIPHELGMWRVRAWEGCGSPQGWSPLSLLALSCYQLCVRAVRGGPVCVCPVRWAVSITSLSVLLFHLNAAFYGALLPQHYAFRFQKGADQGSITQIFAVF